MKNMVIIGLTSLVLFSVSAALSVWLQSSKQTAASTDEKAAKKPKDGDGHGSEKEKEKGPEAGDKKTDSHDRPETLKPVAAGPKDNRDADDRRRLLTEVVMLDMRTHADEVTKTYQRAAAEVKAAVSQATEASDARAAELTKTEQKTAKASADLKKGQLELDVAEQKNLTKLSTLLEQMPPESAAGVVQQMADGGKMDSAVKILAGMKERNAANVMSKLPDTSLAPQLIDRMRVLKRPLSISADK